MFDFEAPRRASRPLPADGIKAQSKQGRFGSRWWTNRFEASIEEELSPRVKVAGKNYARRGQVLWFTPSLGKINATIQGSEKQPYRLEIAFNPVEVPLEPIEEVQLQEHTMSEQLQKKLEDTDFFTAKWIKYSSCSCPSWDDICKHAAAVLYLFIEQTEQEPDNLFLIRENNFIASSQETVTDTLMMKNAWDSRPELALRTAFSQGSQRDMEWLRQVYVHLTRGK
ncbi:MAG: SWIM zinc finger family protein [Micrococcaceae bacterium]